MDDNWKKLFEQVGISDTEKQTEETMEFMYDFVEKRGGIENVTREIEEGRKAPPPPPPPPTSREQDNIGNMSHSPSQTSLSSVDGGIQRRKSKERKESESSSSNDKKGGRKKITKDDMGQPENFQHLGHIGSDPKGGFDVDNVQMDDNWKKLFELVGVTDAEKQTKETMEFIYDFVEKRGGIENVAREIEMERKAAPPPPPPPTSRDQAPPPPSRGPARGPRPPPTRRGAAPPPPPPSRGGLPPPPHSLGAPPPPATRTRATPPPPPPPSRCWPPPPPSSRARGGLSPPPPMSRAPPAPLPPQPIGGGGPPPPPPISSGMGDAHGALLDQIHQKTAVRKVKPNDRRSGSYDDRRAFPRKDVNLHQRTRQTVSQQPRQESCDWVISRSDIQMSDKCLGRGGWAIVYEGTYCGCSVAVKQIHELILSPYNRRLFEREMDIAARCRHPCLLQFIGATNDEGSPLFVTELMETSLRALLEQRGFSETEISTISLDVALALNYLHQKKPSPIIHRDVSSANVLLWRQGDQWKGKVSDYGTAKFMQQTMTVAPGNPIYSAPEALSLSQTAMVDVYSFGVLLCEMCIRELPDPDSREEQVARVTNRVFRSLVRRCLQTDPAQRPNMEEIIEELKQ